jgi:hypothetical protein
VQWLYGWNVSNCLDAGLRELALAQPEGVCAAREPAAVH